MLTSETSETVSGSPSASLSFCSTPRAALADPLVSSLTL
ncbi:hypothetical protein R2601_04558 [Salipiger bermudensis HTCC2601]|uniref:Uncharacterized protein n=1 Tax=Salipiger bermudensis (strain DSM 26914 / JCM 13377 / KCTC 12554 / HTCC2601) TaxID=314265 RepID=Q0FVT4_SALBH|nr:hypothetical protein R2601_04558 [Salipiger bermudensis HTCC2601]